MTHSQMPEILYGTPTKEEMAEARGRAGSRGVMVVPEEMRGHLDFITLDPDEPAPDLDPEQHFGHEDSIRPIDDSIVDITQYSEETMSKVAGALYELGLGHKTVESAINSMQNAGILFRERIPDQEEHTHYTDRATRLCAEGDHDSAVMWDRDAERIKVRENERRFEDREHWSDTIKSENVEATMAEEPIEDRLARAYKNGLLQGLDLGHRAFRNWDHS